MSVEPEEGEIVMDLPARDQGFNFVPDEHNHLGHGKWDYFLPSASKETRQKLWCDNEAVYSVTREIFADQMTTFLSLFVADPATATVLDGTACVGGNSFSLAKTFERVISNELDGTRCDMLRENLKTLSINNCVCTQQDITKVADQPSMDGVNFPVAAAVLDAPWGGVDYHKQDCVELYFGDVMLRTVVANLSRVTPVVMSKVPLNYDADGLLAHLSSWDRTSCRIEMVVSFDLDKFKVITAVFQHPDLPAVVPSEQEMMSLRFCRDLCVYKMKLALVLSPLNDGDRGESHRSRGRGRDGDRSRRRGRGRDGDRRDGSRERDDSGSRGGWRREGQGSSRGQGHAQKRSHGRYNHLDFKRTGHF